MLNNTKSFFSKLLLIAIILYTAALSAILALPVNAEDLPIDINAIGRQEVRDGLITTRIGANLFTEDAQRVNEAMAEQVRQRQAVVQYLFTSAPENEDIEPYVLIMNAANDLALFAQPASFSNISLPQESGAIPIWAVISIITLCAAGGFIGALVSIKKKKGQGEGVH